MATLKAEVSPWEPPDWGPPHIAKKKGEGAERREIGGNQEPRDNPRYW